MWLLLCLVLPLVVQSAPVSEIALPLDCNDIFNAFSCSNKGNCTISSGMYTIYPAGLDNPMQVYCDMSCRGVDSSNTKWTVIQQRFDGSVNFYRPWAEYQKGFGNASGEFWLGLDNIYLITNLERYELRVDMMDFEGGHSYAQYSAFFIDSEVNSYQLHVSGYIDGGAGDSLSYLMGKPFATYDQNPYGSCADQMFGGFWYYCWWYEGISNPNGLYYWNKMPGSNTYNGIMWSSWKGFYYSLKSIQMKIRRVSLADITV
ncbi:microfibril-associated glycoprotein 4-like [Brachyhypopomus gauderio]|uniref:microfibril-associated glycoprotein 4-like n=1 Tax=Brachyhypopomus gauderio TaxID=698409 RepID=UPI0040433DF9